MLAGPGEGTAIGNLLMQAMALGAIRDLDELRDILSGRRNWKAKAEALLRGALDRGGADNITLLIVVCDGGVL